MKSKGMLCAAVALFAFGAGAQSPIALTEAQMEKSGIRVEEAGPGTISGRLELPGEVRLNADRMAHIVPRLEGMAKEVHKNLGDVVSEGDVMLVIESRELADLKGEYLAATERLALYQRAYERERDLFEKRISPEQDFLNARQNLSEARIDQRKSGQKLRALGFSDEYIERLAQSVGTALTRYEVIAPFDGTVIQKHVVRGEVVQADAEVFVLADLDTVWVDLNVYQKDLPFVHEGQRVTISAVGLEPTEGTIAYVGPIVGEESRTALARVVLPNPGGAWRPGLFVSGAVETDATEVQVVVPDSAIQEIENEPHVFVEVEGGFMARPVTLAGRGNEQVAIASGLRAGERVAAEGTFILKAEWIENLGGEDMEHQH